MDIRTIGGHEVTFHDADHARIFMADSRNAHTMRDYLDAARRNGETHLFTPDGNKYKIEHDKDSGKFSVRWVSKPT